MRILLSAYACEPNRGSEAGRGWNWAVNLALRGHEVHVLTRIDGKHSIEKELSNHRLPNLNFHFIDIPEWRKRFISGPFRSFLHYFSWQHHAYLYSRKLADQVDLVHHITWGSLHGGSELWKLKLPFVWGPIGGGQVAPKSLLKYFEEEAVKEKIRTFFTHNIPLFFPNTMRTIQSSRMILVINRETLNRVKALKASQVQLFSDVLLPGDFSPTSPPVRDANETLKILWVGRVYPRKGLNLVMSALQNVKIPFELNIVGDGPWGKKIPIWTEKYRLNGKVHCYGTLPWKELKPIYAGNDVFIFTSLRESFGGQLWEAMSFGLPIITLDCFGARDFVPNDAGIKAAVSSADEVTLLLAQAVERLYNEPELREKMGLAGYRYTQSQTWEKKIIEIESIYENVLGAG